MIEKSISESELAVSAIIIAPLLVGCALLSMIDDGNQQQADDIVAAAQGVPGTTWVMAYKFDDNLMGSATVGEIEFLSLEACSDASMVMWQRMGGKYACLPVRR